MPGERVGFELVAGLGNPGPEYARTRHNAGFWFADALAERLDTRFLRDSRSGSEVATARLEGRRLVLVKPMGFMNHSGRGVSAVARFYKIDPAKVLVAYDELDIPPGHLKLKQGGGHGGHNGMRSLLAHLGSPDFWRLRIGIGHPGHKSQVTGHVLKPPRMAEGERIEAAIELAVSVYRDLLDGDVNVATKALHSHKPESD